MKSDTLFFIGVTLFACVILAALWWEERKTLTMTDRREDDERDQ